MWINIKLKLKHLKIKIINCIRFFIFFNILKIIKDKRLKINNIIILLFGLCRYLWSAFFLSRYSTNSRGTHDVPDKICKGWGAK